MDEEQLYEEQLYEERLVGAKSRVMQKSLLRSEGSAHKRGTVFRLSSTPETVVRVYQDAPPPLSLPGVAVTTSEMSTVVDGVPITVWARVLRTQ